MSGKTRKKGGQSRYTVAAGERICARVAEGMSLRKAADEEHVTHRTVLDWAEAHPAFGTQYARACERRLEVLQDRVLELCELGHEVAQDVDCGRERLQAVKLEIDTLKWLLCKLVPKKYGDRTQMEITGKDGADLLPKHTAEEDAAFLAALAAAQAATPPPGRMSDGEAGSRG